MAREKLTAGRIRNFTCPPDALQVFLWDSKTPGLGIRATQGAKSYVYQGRFNGKVIRLTIGDVRAWPIESEWQEDHEGRRVEIRRGAREEAKHLQGLIDRGIDPRLEKAERMEAHEARRQEIRRNDLKVSEVWKEYLAAHPNWSPRHRLDHERLAHPGGEPKKRGKGKTRPGALAALMPLKLIDITPERVKAWLRDEAAKRPTQARLAFGALRAFLTWCGDMPELAPMTNADSCNRRIAKQYLPEKKAKIDCLLAEQLKAWFTAVRAIPNPTISAYLQILLLTGARREEIASMVWDDVDFRWQSLTIKDKVEGERIIPLTPYVKALLLELKRQNETPPNVRRLDAKGASEWKPSPWVFTSKTADSGRLQEPRKQHNRALSVAGIGALTLHGLRRSFGTLSEWVECPAGVVAQIQGHKPSATAEKHYRRRPLDLLRVWHTRIEAWMLEKAGIEQPNQDENRIKAVI